MVAFLVTLWPGWLEGDGLKSTMLVARGSNNTQIHERITACAQ